MLPFQVNIDKMHRMKIEGVITEQETEKEKLRKAAEKNVQKLEDQMNDANFKIQTLIQEKVMNIFLIYFALNLQWIIIILLKNGSTYLCS